MSNMLASLANKKSHVKQISKSHWQQLILLWCIF